MSEFALREAVERHVARLLATAASDEALATLLEEAKSIDAWMQEVDHDQHHGSFLHLEFHLKLARSTGFKALEATLKRSSIRTLLTTRWLQHQQKVPHPADFHQQLVRVIMKRDPVAADQKMAEHLHYKRTPAASRAS